MKITKNFIPYNKPFFAPESLNFIKDAVSRKTIASDGFYTKKCQKFFADKFHFQYSFLTPSCTAALEMAAILTNISEGDEVIVFGEDLTINFLAAKIDTIPYEILTSISQRVKRIYYYE